MKAVIAVGGKWHLDKLAAQCARKNILKKFITSFPAYAIDSKVPHDKIASFLWYEILSRGVNRFTHNETYIEYLRNWFDLRTAAYLDSIQYDIFVGWSRYCLHSLKKAKEHGSLAVIERGSSHILTSRSLLEEEYSKWNVRFNTALWDRIAEREISEFELADAIFVPSSFVRTSFIDNKYPSEKLFCVPYGVNIGRFRPTNAKKDSRVFKIIAVGIITLRKGQQYLLEAIRQLRKDNPKRSLELYLVGPLWRDMQKIVSDYSDVITFLGKKSNEEVSSLMRECDVLVMPSIEEGLARVMIEAFASGIPVIATPNTGAIDLVTEGQTGFIVPIRDSPSLAHSIQILLDNPDLSREMGVQARQRAEAAFTWDHYGDTTLSHYQRLLEKR